MTTVAGRTGPRFTTLRTSITSKRLSPKFYLRVQCPGAVGTGSERVVGLLGRDLNDSHCSRPRSQE
jgi:hypothetical protein